MTDPPASNVIPLPVEPLEPEQPPTLDDLLASTVLVWDAGDSMKVRCRAEVSKADAARWLRHVADHLDPNGD